MKTTQTYYQAERAQRELLLSAARELRAALEDINAMATEPFAIGHAVGALAFVNTAQESVRDIHAACVQFREMQMELDGLRPVGPSQTTFAGV